MTVIQGSQHRLNYQNMKAVKWRCMHFNHVEKHNLTRKHILTGESKNNVIRDGHDSYMLRHIADLFIEGGRMVTQFYYDGNCV